MLDYYNSIIIWFLSPLNSFISQINLICCDECNKISEGNNKCICSSALIHRIQSIRNFMHIHWADITTCLTLMTLPNQWNINNYRWQIEREKEREIHILMVKKVNCIHFSSHFKIAPKRIYTTLPWHIGIWRLSFKAGTRQKSKIRTILAF